MAIFFDSQATGSSSSTGSFGRTITKTMSVDDVFFDGGDNPLSVNPKARFFYREGQYATIFADIYHAASLGGLTFEDNYNHSTSGFNFILQNGTSALRIKGNGDGDITIGGDISGSATSTGSFGALSVPGQATIGSVVEASSIMYKENVKQIESPLEKITKLRGVEFDYKKLMNIA